MLVLLSLSAQIFLLIFIIWRFSRFFTYFYFLSTLLSIITVLYIINGRSNPGYKIAWLVPVLLFPLFGVVFFMLLGSNRLNKKSINKMQNISRKMAGALAGTDEKTEKLAAYNDYAASQSRYIGDYAFCPPYQNTKARYLPSGEVKFEHLLNALKSAKKYIFLEYFIIEEGMMWDTILEVLVEKAKNNIDVRIIYDDMGCLMHLPRDFGKKLMLCGIKSVVFNPFKPILTAQHNNRDHRKIAVVDGIYGFTGGINLADEYINALDKYGHWKDTAIMLEGEAVWSLTVMFLSMWDYLQNTNTDFNGYKPKYDTLNVVSDGFIQPFADNPLDNEPVGETVYMNIINKARKYVYIYTPYLIADNELVCALTIAAKSGIDVKIITPHIADRRFVHTVTRAYYQILLEAGVEIYEYKPGFMHAKTFAADDEYAVVGSINLDYRSFYLHFESAVWIYHSSCIQDIKKDFLDTLTLCKKITLEECRAEKTHIKLARAALRAFAPLM